MPNRRRIRLAVLLATCLIATRGLWAQLNAGAVVESVAKYSEGEKAGLQEGDVLTSWSRGEAKGELQSPFDLSLIEIEQAPRGTVTLEGLRGADKRTWVIGRDEWRLKTRPALAQDLLATYLDGKQLANAGNLTEAAEHWRAAAAKAQMSSTRWLSTWFLFHTAEVFADARQWPEADNAYQQAAQQAEGTGPVVAAQVLQAWAARFQQRNDWPRAEKYYEQAISECRKLSPDTLTEAVSLSSLGTMARERGNRTEAEQYHRQALEIRERLAPDSLLVASSLNSLAAVAEDRGDLTREEQYLRRSLALGQKLAPEGLGVAKTLNQFGDLNWVRGDVNNAQEYFRRAFAIREKLASDSADLAISLNNLGIVAVMQSNLEQAEEYYHQALAIRERLAPGSVDVAKSLYNLGDLTEERGDLVKAAQYFRRTLEICEKVAPDNTMVSMALNSLGATAHYRGDLVSAQQYYERGLAAARSISPNHLFVAISLGCLGRVALDRGDLTQAEQYYLQSLAVSDRISSGSDNSVSDRISLGWIHEERGDLNVAEKYYREALASSEKLSSTSFYAAFALTQLGHLASRRGNLIEAEEDYRRALAVREKFAPEDMFQGDSLAALAGIMRRKAQPDAAGQLYGQALNVLEGQLSRLGGGEDLRSQFRAKRSTYYKDYIDLLVSQRKPDIAFQVLERLHARTLLEILAAAHIDIRQGVDPSLLQQERALQQSFSTKSNRRVQLLGDKHTAEQLAALDKEINEVLGRDREVEEQIRAASPTYASLTQPQPLSAKEVQQQLVDPNTVLLEYSLGEDRSYVFAVTPTSLAAYELPKRAIIEHLARQVYSSLTTRNSRKKSETVQDWQMRVTKSETEYVDLARQLSQMVLGPVAAQLKGKRLLIVSDGALHYIPFAALSEPQPFSRAETAVPLMVHHEIVNLPSASVLSALRQERARRTPPPKLVAVLADPVFDTNDARLRHAAPEEQIGNNGATRGPDTTKVTKEDTQGQDPDEEDFAGRQLTRSAADVGLQQKGEVRFPRLQLTRQEANNILAITPPGQGMEALDFNASRATALDPNLAQYRIVHFATHGLLDNQHPELSGLVLSLVNEHGKKQNGFLGLQDIYNMNLSADLVVLSACETGLGKQVEGEGLLSLTRGFMYAGAPRVVASLWKIDDLATASLMKEFYKAMEQQGARPAAALREAQLAMWKTHRWSAPYYWAAFQIQGEWK